MDNVEKQIILKFLNSYFAQKLAEQQNGDVGKTLGAAYAATLVDQTMFLAGEGETDMAEFEALGTLVTPLGNPNLIEDVDELLDLFTQMTKR